MSIAKSLPLNKVRAKIGRRDGMFSKWWNTIDQTSLLIIAALISIGVILTFGSSGVAAQRLSIDNPFYFVYRQVIFAGAACFALVFCSFLSLDSVRRASVLLYIGSFAVLILILFIGHEAKGGQRWLKIAGFSLQPSEFIKPAAIILASWVLTRRIYDDGVNYEKIATAIVALPISVFLMQPDVGQSLLLSTCFLIVFLIAGMSIRWAIGLGIFSIIGIIGLFKFMPHFVARFRKFSDRGNSDNYQIERALDAIGSGGIFGRGAGEGVIKQYLPDAQTDFIFSLATEEWGLLGALLLIGLFAILVVRGIHIASKNPDPFAQIAGIGLFSLFGLQVGINLAVNMDLIPAKGMTLPFISYGGSSLLATAVTMGLALALTRRRPGASILR